MGVLQALYSSLANWIAVLTSFVACAILAGNLFPKMSRRYRRDKDPNIVHLELAFSKRRAVQILQKWIRSAGPAAIPAMRASILQLDFAFPVAYATLLSSTFAWLSFQSGQAPSAWVLELFGLPWLAALFDMVENVFLLRLTRGVSAEKDLQNLPTFPVYATSVAATIKFLLLAVSVLAYALVIFKIRRSRA